ncbi:EAL domain-containing protein [Hwanghaeella grinnelliae]|uniref:EAL domain-containing protein n=1 Tax=Hwanghaeella grinnelliae TaxID=2500179 RepID=A0A437QKZ2_9PROT|nr:EAL domain-containing protein [Hwanghaeella grinnelliae]RVU35167.1 EAL domain-containing protein [Hwanghaeella grinnelliae]
MPSETALRDGPDLNLSGEEGEKRWGGEDRRTRPRLRTLVLISLLGTYFCSLLLIYIEFTVIQAGEYATILLPMGLVAVGLGAVFCLGYIYISRRFISPLEEMVVRLRSAPPDVIAPNLGLDEDCAGEIGAVGQFINARSRAVRQAQTALENEIAERRRAEVQLRTSREQLRAISDTAPDAIACMDSDGTVITWNPAAEDVFGCRQDEIYGKPLADLFKDDALSTELYRANQFLNGKLSRYHGELQTVTAKRHEGGDFTASVSLTGWASPDGRFVIAFIRDVSEKRITEERIRFLAHHDPLTELPNRTLFNDRLSQAMAMARRDGGRVALMLLDLDNFKDINDTLGHGVGDRLLQTVADRLNVHKRDTDTVARLGGDEFAIVLPQFRSASDTLSYAKRIIEIVGEPMTIQGQEVQVGTSIGVALYPDDGHDIEHMVSHADMAMYQAKADGRNTFRLFAEQMNAEVKDRKEMLADMREALDNNGFQLAFQPQVQLADQSIVGSEALLRWHHNDRGQVSPSRFIPVAEQGGLIVDLGEWVVGAACDQIGLFDKMGLPPIRIAVNISSVQFRRGNLVECTKSILDRTGVSPDRLEFEITESVVMTDVDKAIKTMQELDTIGVRLSMDDFGTGYSSLSYLRQFPIQKIKIDKSFVQNIEIEENSMEIVNAIIGLSRSMNITVVAEGVETEGQLAKLKEAGCEVVQGFYFGRPMAAQDFESWMGDWHKEPALVATRA